VNPASIVVDTNILFSLLLRGETALRKRFLTDNAPAFHCPRFVFVELSSTRSGSPRPRN
jgi:predicted nucleic acid-binding protein